MGEADGGAVAAVAVGLLGGTLLCCWLFRGRKGGHYAGLRASSSGHVHRVTFELGDGLREEVRGFDGIERSLSMSPWQQRLGMSPHAEHSMSRLGD